MERHNPKIPEGINVTNENALKDFFFMLTGIGLAALALIIALALAAEYLVKFIPFEVEKTLANKTLKTITSSEISPKQQRVENYLQTLANELSNAQQLPKDMDIHIHYSEKSMVNAFATLGGHITVYKGLIEKLPNENALAMVLAHEIAHIKHRDPIIAMGRGLTVGIAIMSVFGAGDSSVSQQLMGYLGQLTALSFSRTQEQQADRDALFTLQQYYGHTEGAKAIFQILINENNLVETPELLSTHPLSQDRIDFVNQFSEQSANTPLTTTSLPLWLFD